MKRFQGETLPKQARIALFANDALGNYIVATPLLTMLRAKYPEASIDFWSGARTAEFWKRDRRITCGTNIYGMAPRAVAQELGDRHYDLVINLESSTWAIAAAAIACNADTYVVGPCLRADGRSELAYSDDAVGQLQSDPEWIAEDLPNRFSFLQTGFIGEIFCRLAYLDGPIPGYEVPREPVDPSAIPDVLIATSASLPEKLWPTEKWEAALDLIRAKGLSVGLLGAKLATQAQFWRGNDTESRLVESGRARDLRGEFSLPQVVGALEVARHVLTLDNGILHLAAATSTPTVGLFRHGIHRLWAPPAPNITVLTPGQDRDVAEIELVDVEGALGIG